MSFSPSCISEEVIASEANHKSLTVLVKICIADNPRGGLELRIKLLIPRCPVPSKFMKAMIAYHLGKKVNPLAIKELVRVHSTSLLISLT